MDPVFESKLNILTYCFGAENFLQAENEFKRFELIEPDKRRFSIAYRIFVSLRDSGITDPFDPYYVKGLHALRDALLGEAIEYDFHRIAKELGISEDGIISLERRIIQELMLKVSLNESLLYQITPREFEQLIGELFHSMGYQVELTKQTRDGGYDLIAVKKIDGLPIKFLVECKRHSLKHPVDVQIVRSFLYVVNQERANKGIIVTTSYFTKDAWEQQSIQGYMLDLRDKKDLLNWISTYSGTISPDDGLGR
jgi:hypothetical protein